MSDLNIDVLTLDGWGQRVSTFRFELLDRQLESIGELEVDRSQPPTISNNVNNTIKRELSGLRFNPSGVNLLRDRVRVWMQVLTADGLQEYPMGVFLFADVSEPITTGVDWIEGTLVDQGLILDQANSRSVGYRPGTLITDCIKERIGGRMIPLYNVASSGAKVRGKEWLTWPAGTTDMEVVNDLCQLAGFYSVYFDNFGVAQAQPIPDLEAVDPDFSYAKGENVFMDSLTRTHDLLTAPNRYIVINNSMTETSIAGRWDIPDSAPHSFQNRGIIVTKVIDSQAVESSAEARAMAKREGQADTSVYEWITLSAPINPLHDTFNVVAFEGVPFHEQGWDAVLQDGADHKHNLRRIYREITDQV